MRSVDVLIVGGGPAGATAALNLAPLRSVVIVERNALPSPRIGESLPAAALRLFRDMGLLEQFLAEGHAPCYGQRSVWGASQPQERDALRDPDGHGWHLDRVRFEQWLRDVAIARGAQFLAPAMVTNIERDGDGWCVSIGDMELRASIVIDAAGRGAPIARRLGAQTRIDDRLVCGWLYGRDEKPGGRGLTFVEATEDGWWYTAPMPNDRRVVAFHTDADLPASRIAHDRDSLLAHTTSAHELGSLLDSSGFAADAESGFTAAHSSILDPCAGDGFLAAGDAALAFDPLSSQGLLNALYTGLAAAETADSHLRGDTRALPRYRNTIAVIAETYRQHLALWYGMEQRWPEAEFWKRRHSKIA
jgi:flavin-dependent dehydrogenase